MKNITIFTRLIAVSLCVCLAILVVGCNNKPKAQLINDAILSESNYKLGDYIGDYSVTDINGNTYTFSQLLAEKKAIVLNFWFINCGPCQMEFPYLQNAYNQYADDVAVIAMNPEDAKEKNIQKYANDNALTLSLAKVEREWATAFGVKAYPTTIVIDCYGRVAFCHTGSIIKDGVFEKIFTFFTSDNYEQSIVNLEDII